MKGLWQRHRALLLFGVFLALLASRRGAQILSPQIWDEEGTIIDGFLDHGWREVIIPLNGYLLLVPKLILGASLAVSLYDLPGIATVLSWLLIAAVGVAVALAPTHLRARTLCALAVFAIPSDPEVFGITLYTCWWAAIILFLLALWDEEHPALGLRLLLLFAAGLSTPVVAAMLPVFCFRAWRFRRHRAERWVAAAAVLVTAVQISLIHTAHGATAPPIRSVARHVVPKLFGGFLVGNIGEQGLMPWIAGLGVAAAIAAWAVRERRRETAWILGYLLVAGVAMSVARMDPELIHLREAGPRYFFLPFVMIAWILAQMVGEGGPRVAGRVAAALLLVAGFNAIPAWSRQHDDLHWAEHLRSSSLFSAYAIPVESDGNRFVAWFIRRSGAEWGRAVGAKRLLASPEQASLPTYAYRCLDGNDGVLAAAPGPETASIPVLALKSGKARATLRLRRGDRVLYKSFSDRVSPRMRILGREGDFLAYLPPTQGWVMLEFGNSRLPETFTVRVGD